MSISATREHLEQELLAFAWKEWSQLGILAAPESQSGWAQDIEALLLFTFEVARADPRLLTRYSTGSSPTSTSSASGACGRWRSMVMIRH